MSNRIWFEDAHKKMDPKLVEQLNLLKTFNLNSHNKLEKELRSING